MIKVDARGKLCPEPLIMTKRALKGAATGDKVEILTDNPTSCGNLSAYLRELGISPEVSDRGDCTSLSFTVKETSANSAAEERAERCACPSAGYCVAIRSDRMGDGDDELGRLLLRAYLNTLPEVDELPSHIVLYNTGVKTAMEGSDTAEALARLEATGVEITSCGTCADFFGIKDRIKVGSIGNMYKIARITAAASHIVYP